MKKNTNKYTNEESQGNEMFIMKVIISNVFSKSKAQRGGIKI